MEPITDGTVTIAGELTAAGKTVPVEFEASVRNSGDRLEIEGGTTVDRTLFGMTWSPLGMAQRDAALHVKATLAPIRTAPSGRECRAWPGGSR
jgi:polyisoprenoid-binding protein YceI